MGTLVLKAALLHFTVQHDRAVALNMLVPIVMAFYSKGIFIPKFVKDLYTRNDWYRPYFALFLPVMVLWYALAVYITAQAVGGRAVIIATAAASIGVFLVD